MALDSNLLLKTNIVVSKTYSLSPTPLLLFKDHLEINVLYGSRQNLMVGNKNLHLKLSEIKKITSQRNWNQFFINDLIKIKTKNSKDIDIAGVSHKDAQRIVKLVNQYKDS